jgi:hypothetical protein
MTNDLNLFGGGGDEPRCTYYKASGLQCTEPNEHPGRHRWPTVEPTPEAHARRTDPETSQDAAASITSKKIRASQSAIYSVLVESGPLCDLDIAAAYAHRLTEGTVPIQSPSGLRTRRSELVDLGRVHDSGRRVKLPSGRESIVWTS